jgi:beta-glucosidase-like glycosyl hydrolase
MCRYYASLSCLYSAAANLCFVTTSPATPTWCSYNAVNGKPTCLDGDAQNGLLRGKYGFDGMIVSDCDAIHDAYRNGSSGHHYTKDAASATALGMRAGTDMDCGSSYKQGVAGAVEDGDLPVATLDTALIHTFTMRMRLGSFDAPARVPYTDISKYGPHTMDSTASRSLALQVAAPRDIACTYFLCPAVCVPRCVCAARYNGPSASKPPPPPLCG